MRDLKFSSILVRIAAIIAVALVYLYVEYAEYRTALSNQKLAVAQQLAVIKSDIEARLQNNIELVKGLATYVSINPDLSQDEFSLYAQKLLTSESNIRVLAASNAYIVTHLYPFEGNEKVFGMDYRELEDQLPSIELALEIQKAVVSGPVEVVQGGQALIVRLPISIDEKNWGIISVVIDYDDFIAQLELNTHPDLHIAIKGRHALGIAGDVFFGNETLFDDSKVTTDIHLPYGNWIVSANPKEGWEQLRFHPSYFVSALVIWLFIYYNMLLMLRNEKLAAESRQSLQASERKFRQFFNLNNAVMLMVDEAGKVIDANKAAKDFYGFDKSALLSRSLGDLRQFIGSSTKENTIESASIYNDVHLTVDGTVKDVEVFSTPIELAGEMSTSLIVNDLTEKRQHEQNWKLYEQVFNYAQEGMFITNSDLQVVSINPAFERITGIHRQEILQQQPNMFRNADRSQHFYEMVFPILKKRGNWRGELWFSGQSDEDFPLLFSINAVKNSKETIINYVAVFSDISQQKAVETQLENLAHFDSLTGLPNRFMLAKKLELAIQGDDNYGTNCALMFLDLDRFKVINDSLGHKAGDELLMIVSRRFKEIIGSENTLARLGGDEFVVLIEDCRQDEEKLQVMAESLCDAARLPFQIADELEVNIGLSIGISQYPKDASCSSELLRCADAAMYKAKKSLMDDVVFYSQDISDDAAALLTISSELKQANAQDQFELLMQPQVNIVSNQVVGAEALVRWHHPKRGFLTPDKFIPLAESTGSIRFVTEWVFQHAIKIIQNWREQGVEMTLSINVSAMELSNRKLFNRIAQAVKLDPTIASAITIEIVESAIVENIEFTKVLLADLRAMGFKIAIDDFGIGFSSLSYLSRLSVDILKIDRAFVNKMEFEKDLAIVRSIIGLAQNFNLSVIAEGIETQEQARTLSSLNCTKAQGYLFSKPISVDQFNKQYLDK